MKKMIFRQGDVLIEKIVRMPNAMRKVAAQNNRYVLARGETTGHAHTILADEAELFIDDDGLMFLHVMSEAVVSHQEHAPLSLPPGDYRVIGQREYAPQEIRRVAD